MKLSIASLVWLSLSAVNGLQHSSKDSVSSSPSLTNPSSPSASRRVALGWVVKGAAVTVGVSGGVSPAWGAAAVQDAVNVDSFLRTGVDAGGNMGVSSQAGKSKPVTGVFLRDGSEVYRDPRTGDVLAEIVLEGSAGGKMAALTSFSSPWALAKGTFFDVECRDSKTSDGAFLAVTTFVDNDIGSLKDSFFLENLLAPTGRFSFYGSPTDVKVKKSFTKDGYRVIDLSFATLSQSTQTEIPRKARLVATIPKGSKQAVMLIGSASTTRWNKGASEDVIKTMDSFRSISAPQTSLKIRRKERDTFSLE